MLILLVRCLTLPGALFGQQFLFVPSLDDFLQPKVSSIIKVIYIFLMLKNFTTE